MTESRVHRIRLWKGYHSPELLGLVAEAWREGTMLVLCPPGPADLAFLPDLPEGEIELVGEPSGSAATGDWSGSAATGGWTGDERELASALARRPRETAYPERPILGVFTSGTVGGKPRLVLYSKRNVESSLGAILEVFDRDRIDAIFCYPQPFHTFGLVLGYIQAVATGRPLFAPNGRYSSDFHRAWRETAADHPGLLTLGTPTHFADLVKAAEGWGPAGAPPTYSTIIGGAAVPRALWVSLRDRLRVAAPSIGYGCTEASPGLTHLPPGCEPTEDGEIGGVLAGIRLELVPGTGLEFSGPQTCLAIVEGGRVEFPRKVLIRDRLRARADSRFVFEGRTDLVFNRGGVKFSLEEIERALREDFPDSAFLGVAVPDARLGEELGLLVRSAEAPTEAFRKAITAALHEKFRAHFDPGRIVWVADLPLNAAAKPDRGTGARLVVARGAEAFHAHPR